ncbi:MAG: hypothetical protein WC559_06110 [Candidatus Omnitrophota bacterium]
MNIKAKKNGTARSKKTGKKWTKPKIEEHRLQDESSSAFDEILLAPNDPAVT